MEVGDDSLRDFTPIARYYHQSGGSIQCVGFLLLHICLDALKGVLYLHLCQILVLVGLPLLHFKGVGALQFQFGSN